MWLGHCRQRNAQHAGGDSAEVRLDGHFGSLLLALRSEGTGMGQERGREPERMRLTVGP